MLPLLSLLAAAADPIVGTWVLTEGWMGMEMVLVPPKEVVDREDYWIGIVFSEDGRITWETLRYASAAELGGCSNSFDGFSGEWEIRRGRTVVSLREWTVGGETFPGEFVVTTRTDQRLVLTPLPR